MQTILGSGEHRYAVVENWAKLPEGWEFKDAAAVACDNQDKVYVFNRGEHPMIVFDREGNFLRSWGEGSYPRAHGLAVDSRGDIYVGEVSYTEYPRLFPDNKIPWRMRSLQKLEKVS